MAEMTEEKKTTQDDKPSILIGALVGVLVTAPTLAVGALISQLFGAAFTPFVFFDWFGRAMPGNIITFGIDSMVDTLILLGISVADTAKTVEQSISISMILGMGAAAGVLVFLAMRKGFEYAGIFAGILLATFFGIITLVINPVVTAPLLFNVIWIVASMWLVGYGIGMVYNRLATPAVVEAEEKQPEAIAVKEHMSFEQIDRRQFLIRAGTTSAAVTVVGAGLATVLKTTVGETIVDLPAAASQNIEGPVEPFAQNISGLLGAYPVGNPNATLEPAPGTRPEITPVADHYQIDINATPPVVAEETWRLSVTGFVNRPREFTLQELVTNFEPVNEWVTLACISNRIGGNLTSTTRWTGVRLSDVLEEVGVQRSEASHVYMQGADNFFEYLDLNILEDDDRIMLAYAWDGEPLPTRNGFPLRIWIPNRYGMKQPKWLTNLELVAGDGEGYWVRRGWSPTAIMRTVSVIDTVAIDDVFEQDGQMFVPVGGMAHAGVRGISRVEVRVDGGDWEEAELREPVSDATWVLWRYDWPYEEGRHNFEVRAVDGDGDRQIEEPADVRPDGATGIHHLTATLD